MTHGPWYAGGMSKKKRGTDDRTRISIELPDAHKRAFLAFTAIARRTPTEVFCGWIEDHCGPQLAAAREQLEAERGGPPGEGRPRKR